MATYDPNRSNKSGSGRDMGLGNLAKGNVVFKRKYRWTMKLVPHCGAVGIPEYYVKTANIIFSQKPIGSTL